MITRALKHLLYNGFRNTFWKTITTIESRIGSPNALFYPREAWLEVTNRCNTVCRHCDRFYQKLELGDMPVDLFNIIRDQLFDQLQKVTLQGYGEPLFAPDFDTFYSEVVKHGITPAFTSNGILLNDENLKTFVQDGVELTLSMDGATAASFNRVRPKIEFDHIMHILSTVKLLKQTSPSRGFVFRVNFVLMKDNLHELTEMMDLAGKYNIDELHITNLITADFMGEEKFVSISAFPEETRKVFAVCREMSEKSGVKFIHPKFSFLDYSEENSSRLPVCSSPWRSIYIDYKGNMKPCCLHYYPSLGNVRDGDILKIWNDAVYKALRRTVNSRHPNEWCATCCIPPRHHFDDIQREDLNPWQKTS